MPVIGEIKRGREIGESQPYIKYEWSACLDCGKERWIYYNPNHDTQLVCRKCANERESGINNVRWKGGREIRRGYIIIKIRPDDFFYPMSDKKGRILEHRLVMAKSLGRCLHDWEIVHHKNHIKDDNRIENLQLVSDDRHKQITILENRIKQLETRVTLLEAENIALRKYNVDPLLFGGK
jgi:hypothetical protein